jgi:hypothetical protein
MLDVPFSTALSYFDDHDGPVILAQEGETAVGSHILNSNEITHLMDVHQTGDFFVHYFQADLSFNYCFGVKDKATRGGEHAFMVSVIVNLTHLSKEQFFAQAFTQLGDIELWLKQLGNSLIRSTLVRNLMVSKNFRDWDAVVTAKNLNADMQTALLRCANRYN